MSQARSREIAATGREGTSRSRSLNCRLSAYGGTAAMSKLAIVLLVSALAFTPRLAMAQATPSRESSGHGATKASSVRGRQGGSTKVDNGKAAANLGAPCSRGKWKDDPVCYGEGRPDALPTPSPGSAEPSGGINRDVSIRPRMNINPRTGAGVIYKSNGDALGSDFGAGVGMRLPFF